MLNFVKEIMFNLSSLLITKYTLPIIHCIDRFHFYVNISLNLAYIHFINISKDIFLILGGLSTVCDLLKMPSEKV